MEEGPTGLDDARCLSFVDTQLADLLNGRRATFFRGKAVDIGATVAATLAAALHAADARIFNSGETVAALLT